jgi:hypothetical protein
MEYVALIAISVGVYGVMTIGSIRWVGKLDRRAMAKRNRKVNYGKKYSLIVAL